MSEFLKEPTPITAQLWGEDTVPLVSISCITYNHEKYIRDAIEGFLMQKTTFPIEILIHDDASTDNTATIVREYEVKYPQLIKPIYQTENQYSKKDGTIGRIQRGRARGKYYATCEGDDYWTDPLKLQKQVEFLENNSEYVACYHNAIINYVDKKNKNHLYNKINESRNVSLEEIINNWSVPTASIVMRKKVIDNLPDWRNNIYSGDYTLILLCLNIGKLYFINEVMSVYNVSLKGSSASSQIKGNSTFVFNEHIKLLKYFNEYTNEVYNSIIKKRIKSLNNEIAYYELKEKGVVKAMMKFPKMFFEKLINRLRIELRL
jgi:glycosyltransferase involved in cell wall biosynthesis